jgi:hypothetical protein
MPSRPTHSQSRFLPVLLVCAMLTSMTACASPPVSRKENTDFSGVWSVKWCDKQHPERDCGGINLDLVQKGDLICGSYAGVTSDFTQQDEAPSQAIIGSVVGNTAIVSFKSGRNENIRMARLVVSGGSLQWRSFAYIDKVFEEFSPASPNDNTFERGLVSDTKQSEVECASFFENAKE